MTGKVVMWVTDVIIPLATGYTGDGKPTLDVQTKRTLRSAVYQTEHTAVFARYAGEDIEWLIATRDTVPVGVVETVPLDKYDAIRRADEWQAAIDARSDL